MKRILQIGLLILTLSNGANAQTLSQQLKKEGIPALAKAARAKGDAIRGAVLLPQEKLGCANCHLAGHKQLLGPDLTLLEKQTPDEYLVESILAPSKTIKKGFESSTLITTAGQTFVGRVVEQNPKTLILRVQDTKSPTAGGTLVTIQRDAIEAIKQNDVSAMPENLADLLSSRQEFLDVVKYLMELAARDSQSLESPYALAEGNPLDEAVRGRVLIDRFRCEVCHGRLDPKESVPLNPAPNLVRSLHWIHPNYAEQFIADPHQVKPGTSMPQVMGGLSKQERQSTARAIASYLDSQIKRTPEKLAIESMDIERGRELFHSVGCVACHAPRDRDGTELLKESSIPLGDLKSKYPLPGLVAFLKNPRAARPGGRMPNLNLTHWEALDVAGYLLDFSNSRIRLQTTEANKELAAEGKKSFEKLGCVRCHSADNARPPADQISFARMHPERGCLSESPGKWPRYQFTASQKTALRTAIGQPVPSPSVEQQITTHLAALNCFACHQRNGLGGVANEREDYFQTTNHNLGPQGRIPPSLTGIGAKLEPKALRDVLINGQSVRPYMKTRMPQFGEANTVPLIRLFEQTDHLPPLDFGTFQDQKQIHNAGWELAGSGGLNCIACHTFQLKPAKTMPAMDLTVMGDRLQKRWFYHYLQNPQRFHPGTVMPSFWPGGQSMRKDVLEGKAELQIEALWQYLLDGRQARTPRGLIVKSIELLATEEAVMLRRSYPNIGKRGIGVGYPTGVNLAFDAEQMRLGMIWKGKFADPAGVWRSQGHGNVRPLGEDLIRFADGPELEDAEHPWTADQGRPPHHQFRGYFLDDKQRPTLQYQFRDIHVQDFFRGLNGKTESSPGIRRTITLSGQQNGGNLRFRAAVGKTIAPVGDDAFLVDGKLNLKITSPQKGAVVESTGGKQLIIPVDLSNGKSQLVVEYLW